MQIQKNDTNHKIFKIILCIVIIVLLYILSHVIKNNSEISIIRTKYLADQCQVLSDKDYKDLDVTSIKNIFEDYGYYFESYVLDEEYIYSDISNISPKRMYHDFALRCVIKTNKDSEMIEDIYYITD